MAAISSNSTGGGLASATTTWVGGVVPVAIDNVTIAAGDVVTMDATFAWNSLNVNGVLSASRTVSSGLVLTGNMHVNAAATFDLGTVASPLQTGITHSTTITCNTVGQYGITFNTTSEFYSKSVDVRNPFTVLTSDTAIGSSIINVADASGWVVGDELLFESAVQGLGIDAFKTTIASITALQITMTNPAPYLLNGTTEPYFVTNTNNAISILSGDAAEAYNSKNPYINISRTTGSVDNGVNLQDITFRGFGRNAWTWYGAIRIAGGYNHGHRNKTYNNWIQNAVFMNCHAPVSTSHGSCTMTNVAYVSDGAHATNRANSAMSQNVYDAFQDMANVLIMNSPTGFRGKMFDSKGTNVNIVNAIDLDGSASADMVINGGVIRSVKNSLITSSVPAGTITYRSMTISRFGRGLFTNAYGKFRFIGCSMTSPTIKWLLTTEGAFGQMLVADLNGSTTDQRLIDSRGIYYRDTVIGLSPATKPASIRLEPARTDGSFGYSLSVTLLAGHSLAVTAQMQKNAAYNGATLPLIRLKGSEFDTVQAMTATNNAFETVSITSAVATNTHTVTVSVEVIGTAGAAWFDDLTIDGSIHDAGQSLFAGGTEISTVIDITDTAKSVNLTGLIAGSDVVILNAGTNTVLGSVNQNAGSTWLYSSPVPQTIDIGIINPSYVTQYIYGYSLNQKGAALPIIQLKDRSYT